MKKILLTDGIKTLIEKEQSFLDRSNIKLFTASTHEEALRIHGAELVNLIITRLNLPEMSSETFCSMIREDRTLCNVSIMIVCNNTPADVDKSSRCKANAVIMTPVSPHILFEKIHQLLNISRRESYRVLLSVRMEGRFQGVPFFCRTENVSISGMLIETDKDMEKGDRVTCSFFLRDSTNVIIDGEIVRVAGKVTEYDTNQYGIKFTRIPPEAQAALVKFIEEEKRRYPALSDE